jgi:hypothetical protein
VILSVHSLVWMLRILVWALLLSPLWFLRKAVDQHLSLGGAFLVFMGVLGLMLIAEEVLTSLKRVEKNNG